MAPRHFISTMEIKMEQGTEKMNVRVQPSVPISPSSLHKWMYNVCSRAVCLFLHHAFVARILQAHVGRGPSKHNTVTVFSLL